LLAKALRSRARRVQRAILSGWLAAAQQRAADAALRQLCVQLYNEKLLRGKGRETWQACGNALQAGVMSEPRIGTSQALHVAEDHGDMTAIAVCHADTSPPPALDLWSHMHACRHTPGLGGVHTGAPAAIITSTTHTACGPPTCLTWVTCGRASRLLTLPVCRTAAAKGAAQTCPGLWHITQSTRQPAEGTCGTTLSHHREVW
jgi:hypothetical protein